MQQVVQLCQNFQRLNLLFKIIQITFAALKKNRGVEQLVARRAHNPEVIGPSPIPATVLTDNQLVIICTIEDEKVSRTRRPFRL